MTGFIYSMKQGPSSAADSFGFSLRNFTFVETEVSYRIHKSPFLGPVLS